MLSLRSLYTFSGKSEKFMSITMVKKIKCGEQYNSIEFSEDY